jgi:FkbM family methyltransferase
LNNAGSHERGAAMVSLAGVQRAYVHGGLRLVLFGALGALAARTPRHTIRVGASQLLLRVAPDCRDALRWEPNWKSQIIAAVLSRRDGVFIDVGANVGQTLLDYLAAPRRSGYLGFEPFVRCANYITAIIEDNRLRDCVLAPAALSDRNSVLKLYRNPDDPTDSAATLVGDLRPTAVVREELASCYRFDDIREALGISGGIALVKIDVEGAEMAVLEGMRDALRTDRPWVLCEVLDRDAHADEAAHRARREALNHFVKGLNYVIFHVEHAADNRMVTRLIPMDGFPCRPWIEAVSREGCDYLLAPVEDRQEAATLMDAPPDRRRLA